MHFIVGSSQKGYFQTKGIYISGNNISGTSASVFLGFVEMQVYGLFRFIESHILIETMIVIIKAATISPAIISHRVQCFLYEDSGTGMFISNPSTVLAPGATTQVGISELVNSKNAVVFT